MSPYTSSSPKTVPLPKVSSLPRVGTYTFPFAIVGTENFVAGANTARFNFLLGYLIAQDEGRPQWNDGDFFGKTFGSNK